MGQNEIFKLVVCLSLLLIVAHCFGALARKLKQPTVAGELTGGILVGPSLLGAVSPNLQATLFPSSGSVATVIDALAELGMLMLMFLAGSELRRLIPPGQSKLTFAVIGAGLLVPFGFGLVVHTGINLDAVIGPAGSKPALILIIACAIAVTSIPVISRIMLDLGILSTSFAGVVLSAAVAEDILLYIVIAIALGLASAKGDELTGLPDLIGLSSGIPSGLYYAILTCLLVLVSFTVVPRIAKKFYNGGFQRNGSAFASSAVSVVAILVSSALCLSLGLQPMFGAFLVGAIIAQVENGESNRFADGCRPFAFSFFLPVYFASIGLTIDLTRNLDLAFTCMFIALACSVKLIGVYLGARIGRQNGWPAIHLAVAMNARGGPGLALATLSFETGIVNANMYVTLVMLPIITSLLAGSWLRHVLDWDTPLLNTADESVVQNT